jgi:membrane protein YdbS with pleckstrin-like domain
MECLVQYLDDLEDLLYALALKAERIRQALQFFLSLAAAAALQVGGVFIALKSPPIAVAVASLLLVGMLYRAVVGPAPEAARLTC